MQGFVTREQLRQLAPYAGPKIDVYLPHLNAAMGEFGIDNDARRAAFLAQVIHESGQLAYVSENLNYSAAALLRTWPTRFDSLAHAKEFERKPEIIANFVYANRMGNGDFISGDGWRFRGSGLIQLTGKDNQSACAEHFGIAVADIGDWLRAPEGACHSAGWFWWKNGLNPLADRGDIKGISRRINGGTVGLDERLALTLTAKQVLA